MKFKRTMSMVWMFVFLFSLCSRCIAEKSMIQYVDTYWVMYDEICKDLGVERVSLVVPHEVEILEKTDEFVITGYPGIFMVRQDDLRVNRVLINIYQFDATEEETERNLIEVLAKICALEYDVSAMRRDAIGTDKEFDYDVIYSQALDIFENVMLTTLIENFDRLGNGEDVVLYEGNYRYTTYGYSTSGTNESIYVMAEVIE